LTFGAICNSIIQCHPLMSIARVSTTINCQLTYLFLEYLMFEKNISSFICTTLVHTDTRAKHTFKGQYMIYLTTLFIIHASFLRFFFVFLFSSNIRTYVRNCLLSPRNERYRVSGLAPPSILTILEYDRQLQPNRTCILNRDNSILTYLCVCSLLVLFRSRLPPSFATARSASLLTLFRSSSFTFTISFTI
jgi:hypothetical protein